MSTSASAVELELDNLHNGTRTSPQVVSGEGHHICPSQALQPPMEAQGPVFRDLNDNGIAATATSSEPVAPGKLRSAGILITLASISLLNTFNSGILTVALPTMARDLPIPSNLLLWPASVYALGLSCFLLPLGAITDLIGARPTFLTGTFLYTVFTLGVSLARSSDELILFRVLQGIAMAFCMPPAVSTITNTFPTGRDRNVAFAVFGGGSPIGFATGLVLGGVLVQVSSWRTGYWISTSVNGASMVLGWIVIPGKGTRLPPMAELRHRLATELDWVGVISASSCLALLSYVFAELTNGSGAFTSHPYTIALLIVASLLVPLFVYWEGRQERLGRPAVLPNSIWQRREFTAVCLSVFLTWSWFNAFGYWATLWFQDSQGLDALQTALRFLPLVVVGLATNILAAVVMDRVNAGVLSLVSGLVSAAAPLIFVLQDLRWSYWMAAFPAMVLSAISTDLLFNISNLVITTNFPGKSQGLAGGVFNTVSQLGNSIGLAVTAMIAAAVTDAAGTDRIVTEGGLTYDYSALQGYKSGFWTCFAAAILSAIISSVGLRKAGKVGEKKEL